MRRIPLRKKLRNIIELRINNNRDFLELAALNAAFDIIKLIQGSYRRRKR
jgi:hypothetical protein